MAQLKHIPAQGRALGSETSRVLVFEPDRPLRALLAEWVEMAGYRFLDGHTSANAAAPCELILIDVRAPLRSARQAIEAISAALPQAAMVAMSADLLASGRLATEAVARELRVAALLVKPFDREALMRALERARAGV